MSLYVIGIDPGLTGALAMLGPEGLVACSDIPIMQKSMGAGTVKNQVNAAALTQLLRGWTHGHDNEEILVVLEYQAPIRIPGQKPQGSAGVFSLGHTAGILEGVVVARGLRHQLVTPVKWKKALKLPGGPKGKGVVRSQAQRLYPEADLRLVKHHNRAEAIMIAHWARLEHA